MSLAFTPLPVGPITLPNRFIRSGANEMMTRDGAPTHALRRFHRRLAEGGVGLTTLAYVAVSQDGRTFEDQGVLSPGSLRHYQAVTAAVREAGGMASAQITHAGSFAQHRQLSTRRAMSADAGLDKVGLMLGRPWQRRMGEKDIAQVRDEFVAAARLARDAGFSAVELHMGHGYLLNQFISPLSNHRRDAYGGSAERRARFPAEVLAAVKEAVGRDLAVLAKINLFDAVAGGADVGDAVITAKALEAAGADMLVLSGGRNIESAWAIFSAPLPYDDLARLQTDWSGKLQMALLRLAAPKAITFSELYFLAAARRVRQAVATPLCYVGGVLSLKAVEQVLAEDFQAVAMARALVHDPALVARWRTEPEHRSACDACNRCVATMYTPPGTYCVVTDNAIDPRLNQAPAGIPL
jgi:2,4-dienoyl-CoA reductase-like NADH-dependent reductase (Old Yellow Enzyme family)